MDKKLINFANMVSNIYKKENIYIPTDDKEMFDYAIKNASITGYTAKVEVIKNETHFILYYRKKEIHRIKAKENLFYKVI